MSLENAPSRELSDRIRLDLRFDPLRLQGDLALLREHAWTNHFVKANYTGSWSAIPLRCKVGATHPNMMIFPDPTATEFVATPVLDACPYFQEVLAHFEAPLKFVRLMRLTPGSEIKEHSDPDLDADFGQVRIHIPIASGPDVDFYLNGTTVSMEVGSCWYLRLADPHRVVNRGLSDRVHLVIDANVNQWVLDQLRRGSGPS